MEKWQLVEGKIIRVFRRSAQVDLGNGYYGILPYYLTNVPRYDFAKSYYIGKIIKGKIVEFRELQNTCKELTHIPLINERLAFYDPWDTENISKYAQVGKIIIGQVTKALSTHADIEIYKDVVGQINITDLMERLLIEYRKMDPKWICSPESVIGGELWEGDWVGAQVSNLDFENRIVSLDPLPYIMSDGETIIGTPVTLPQNIITDSNVASENEYTGERTVLILEHDPSWIFAITIKLKNLGFIVEICDSFELLKVYLQKPEAQPDHPASCIPKIVLLDKNWDNHSKIRNNQLWEIFAQAIRNQWGEYPYIILVTGDDSITLSPSNLYNDCIYKSCFEEEFIAVISALQSGHLYRERQGIKSLPSQLLTPSDRRNPITNIMNPVLQSLCNQYQASKAAIFGMDPISETVIWPAVYNVRLQDLEKWKHRLSRSPIRDVCIFGETYAPIDAGIVPQGLHLFLRYAINYRGALGIGLPSNTHYQYALYLFFDEPKETYVLIKELKPLCLSIRAFLEYNEEEIEIEQQLKALNIAMTRRMLIHEVYGNIPIIKELSQELAQFDKMSLEKNERTKEIISRLSSLSHRTNELVKQYQKYSQDQSPLTISIIEPIRAAINDIKSLANDLEVEILEDFPNETVYISCVPIQFEQVIYNLLNNAILHCHRFIRPTHKIAISVTFDYSKYKNMAIIRIADNGPGIHKKRYEQREIYRLGNTTRIDGSGTGLNIVYNWVTKRMNGQIEVEKSIVFGGTIFRITLPIK